jgi:hypothetical protein
MAGGRTTSFERNPRLDEAIAELEPLLRQVDDPLVVRGQRPQMPVTFVIGGPRSGSTVTMQLLAASGAFTYPTNLLARFASAPVLGARIQALLTDPALDFRGELNDVGSPVSFSSDLGKSSGAMQPNEFWFWWRRFTPTVEPAALNQSQRDTLDLRMMAAEAAGIQHVTGRPLACDAMHLQLDLDLVADAFPTAIFLDVRRAPAFQMQSLLEARRRFFNDDTRWYSLKPSNFEALRDRSPAEQIAGQVLEIHRRLDALTASLESDRYVHASYESLCRDPSMVLDDLVTAYAAHDAVIAPARPPRDVFRHAGVWRLPPSDQRELTAAWTAAGGDPSRFTDLR